LEEGIASSENADENRGFGKDLYPSLRQRRGNGSRLIGLVLAEFVA
jgi:hypothetical protein